MLVTNNLTAVSQISQSDGSYLKIATFTGNYRDDKIYFSQTIEDIANYKKNLSTVNTDFDSFRTKVLSAIG
jgi:hypothetical protein